MDDKDFKILVLVLLGVILWFVSLTFFEVRADESYHTPDAITLLPTSWHHNAGDKDYNEDQQGLGFEWRLTNDSRLSYIGVMRFKNSFYDTGLMAYAGKNYYETNDFKLGVIGAFAPVYIENGDGPGIAVFLTAEYHFIRIVSVPSVLTAVQFVLPL